jgi:hypothetical protein
VLWIFDGLTKAWNVPPCWVTVQKSGGRDIGPSATGIPPSIPVFSGYGRIPPPESQYPEDTQFRFRKFLNLLVYLSMSEPKIIRTESFEILLKLIPDLRKPFDASQWDLFWSDSIRPWCSGMSQVIMKTNFWFF